MTGIVADDADGAKALYELVKTRYNYTRAINPNGLILRRKFLLLDKHLDTIDFNSIKEAAWLR